MTRGMDYQILAARQRRNLKAYLKIIHQTRKALNDGDVVRALALVSANTKYPPEFVRGLHSTGDHWICTECGCEMEEPNG